MMDELVPAFSEPGRPRPDSGTGAGAPPRFVSLSNDWGGGLISGCEPDESSDLAVIPAGWPEQTGEGCVTLDPAAILRATPRSFALRVRGQSMIGAGIQDGDIVIGEFRPEARPGAIVVALIDGESVLKRLVLRNGRPQLVSENPNCPDPVALSELVIQGIACMLVRRVV